MDIDYIKCGDYKSLIQEIPDKSIDLIMTDIPYQEINTMRQTEPFRKAKSIRKIHKGDADSGEQFVLGEFLEEALRVCKGSMYIFCGSEQLSTIRKTLVEGGYTTRVIIWEKTNPSPMNGQTVWLSGIELCVYGKLPGAVYNGFCENTVLRFPSGSSKNHPTEKPVKLFEKLISQSTNKGDLVLDPLIGSGTTAVAAYRLDRHFIGYELNPDYYEYAKKRIEDEQAQIRWSL